MISDVRRKQGENKGNIFNRERARIGNNYNQNQKQVYYQVG